MRRYVELPPRVIRCLDVLCNPFTLLGAIWFRLVRNRLRDMPRSKRTLMNVEVFPIVDHYYEPMFNMAHLRTSLQQECTLPGIDFNVEEELSILGAFRFSDELAMLTSQSLTFSVSCHSYSPRRYKSCPMGLSLQNTVNEPCFVRSVTVLRMRRLTFHVSILKS
jgi:hypothetical protein